jgi:hypothetical protein
MKNPTIQEIIVLPLQFQGLGTGSQPGGASSSSIPEIQ